MFLKIYYGSRIEDLAEHLKERLLEERRRKDADSFEFLKVAVANPNLGN